MKSDGSRGRMIDGASAHLQYSDSLWVHNELDFDWVQRCSCKCCGYNKQARERYLVNQQRCVRIGQLVHGMLNK